MLSNSRIKLIHSLAMKKYRKEYGLFVVEGEKMVAELLRQTRIEPTAIYGTEAWVNAHESLLAPFWHCVQVVSEAELKKASGLSTPNGALALAKLPQPEPDFNLPVKSLCFFLDGLQDPGNAGAILRIADWFGLPAVYGSPETVDLFNPKVIQASMGAVFRVPGWELSLTEILEKQPGLTVAGAVFDGENVFQGNLPGNGLLVIGNEGRGIAPETEKLLTRRLTIPRHPGGGAESLNAAIAAGILAALCTNSRSE